MFLPEYQSLVRFSDEKMTKVSLYESKRMFADLYCLKPGQEQSLHRHDSEDKIYFVLEGNPTLTISARSETLARGETCVAQAGQDHGVNNNSESNAVLLVVMAPHPKPPSSDSDSE